MGFVKIQNAASQLIQNVIATYNTIGTEFDASRRKKWPEFRILRKAIINKIEDKKSDISYLVAPQAGQRIRLLDSGCGNGRVAHFFKDLPINYFGYDGSTTLIRQARRWWSEEKNSECDKLESVSHLSLKAQFSVGSILTKNYKTFFDVIVSSAVLHHLPTPELQYKQLKKLYQQLAPDGLVYISVWNLWQQKYEHLIDPKTKACYVPWKTYTRYYYAFEKEELINLLTTTGFATLEEVPSIHNFCFLAWKK